MINFGALGQWKVIAPPGLTGTGRIRRFQERTVRRLGEVAEQIASETNEELRAVVESTYTEGTGALADTLQYRVNKSRDEINVEFVAGTRHVVYLTALAGQPTASPGHKIPRAGKGVRFFWKNPLQGGAPGVYSFRSVKWRTRQGRGDVMSQVLSAGALRFQRAMIAAHEAALVEFVQNELQLNTRSTRVGVTAGSGIPPQ
jgi:hypothetical protein